MLLARNTLAEITPWVTAHGYVVIFLCLTLETVLFTSMVVPGLLVLIVGGFYAGLGHLNPILLVGTAVGAVWLGDTLSYSLGRLLWSRLVVGRRFGPLIARVRPALETRSAVFLMIYHFEPIARMVGAATAGVVGLSVRRWLPYAYFGGVLWVLFYASVGYLLGRLGRDVAAWERLRPLSLVFTIVLLSWLMVIWRALRPVIAEPGAAVGLPGDSGEADR